MKEMHSAAQMTDAGVDGENGMLLLYEDGRMAVLNSGIHGKSDSQGVFYGSKGCMIVENVNNLKQSKYMIRKKIWFVRLKCPNRSADMSMKL